MVTSKTGKGGGEEAPAWVVQVNESLGKGDHENSASPWTIYRVPKRLREAQESAFIPKLVSVGPFHLKDGNLKAMNERKMQILVRLLERHPKNSSRSDGQKAEEPDHRHPKSTKLDIITEEMKKLEEKARACYSDKFGDIPSDEFVRMMVVDGCFVIELLRRHHFSPKQKEKRDDTIFPSHCMLRTIQRDLLLLENQLPFFVLKRLFDLTSVHEERSGRADMDEGVNGRQQQESVKLEELVISFFEPLVLPKRSLSYKMAENEFRDCHHLLDVFRHTFIIQINRRAVSWKTGIYTPQEKVVEGSKSSKTPTDQSNNLQEKYKQLMHPATELEECGVSIRKKMVTPDFDFLSIEFNEDGTLIIPPLFLDDYTVSMLLNFLAFEQCKGIPDPFVSNYFMFWDGLIDTEADVEILHRQRVINHFFGSGKDVVTLLNKVGREITYDQNHCFLHNQMKGLNIYCDKYHSSRLRKWWRKLLLDYFSTPWTFLSLVGAVMLLILTFLQTFYAIYGFHGPRDGSPQN